MTQNNNETKNYKKLLFNHTKENYQTMEQVIKQSNEAGFDEWQRQENQTLKELAEYLLFFGPLPKKFFTMISRPDFSSAKNKRII
jgi:hypothetical protein